MSHSIPRSAGSLQESEPYTLVVTAWNGGFFSHVNRVVNHLHHSLGHDGCAAIRVEWQVGEHTPLFVYGTAEDGELWERFFEPLSFPGAPAEERSSWEYADLSMTGLHAYRMYKGGAGWRKDYGRAYANHVRVREDLRGRVEDLWRNGGVASRAIGVHFRHPEHSHECPRQIPTVEVFIEWTRRLLRRERDASIVLATDVREAVDSFREAFGERLLVQPDVARAPVGETQYEWGAPPGIALGEQTLIDALLLARCDVLLHTTSNIATAAGYMNPNMRMIYCEPKLVAARGLLSARLKRRRDATLDGVSRRTLGQM
jgi:hypothetical protein